MSREFPRFGVGLVHGIEDVYRVDWVAPDLAYLVEPESDELLLDFASRREGGFINDNDVLDQASEIVANWDSEDI